MGKLVLSRKKSQRILVGDKIAIEVLQIKGGTVRIGIEAPQGIKVIREELINLPPAGEDATKD
jgi:carbon storage regulator